MVASERRWEYAGGLVEMRPVNLMLLRCRLDFPRKPKTVERFEVTGPVVSAEITGKEKSARWNHLAYLMRKRPQNDV